MKTTRKILLFGFLALFLSSIVYAKADSTFVFSHKYHKEMGIEDCSTCHMSVSESVNSSDDLLPTAETCQMCHGDEVVPPPADFPRSTDYIPHFSHKKHVSDENVECTTCHTGIMDSEQPVVTHLPTMQTCFTCHASKIKEVPQDCYTCHTPDQKLTPKSHTVAWKKTHGMPANAGREECSTCHVNESFCQNCHFGDNVTQQSHPMNWEYSHGVEAKQQSSNCSTCHENKQFCVECHAANLVMPVTHSAPDWANATTGGRHATEASMDVDNCTACHASPGTDPTCLECHSK